MKQICILEPGRMEIQDVAPPEPGPGEVRIRVMASGICGTDVHIYRGEYLGDYPVVPGHEFAGVVDRVGSLVRRFAVGDRVTVEPNISCNNCGHCLHNRQNFCENWEAIGVTRAGAMAELVVVPENAAFSIGDLAFEAGALVEPLSCVLHGVRKVGIEHGDRVAILGAGPIGILLLQALLLRGASRIVVAERRESRASFAREMGAARTVSDMDELEEDGYDLVVDATGSTTVMARTPGLARHGGTVLLFGVPPSGERMEIEPFVVFRKGLSIHGSYTSVRNTQQAIALLDSGRIEHRGMVSHRLPLHDLDRGIGLLESGSEDVRKVMILPDQGGGPGNRKPSVH